MSKQDITQWPEIMASLERLKAKGFTAEDLLAAVRAVATKKRKGESQLESEKAKVVP